MKNVSNLSNQSKSIYLELLKLEIGLNNKNSNINIVSAGKLKKKQYKKKQYEK